MSFNLHTVLLVILATVISFVTPYVTRNSLPLASKVIFQSPMMENIYKEFVLSSKPLNLKKYATAKPKNSIKDSKIYYIPIAPMPYRFIPGIGYDYQPVKINSIPKDSNARPQPPAAATPQQNVIIKTNAAAIPLPMPVANTKVTRLNGHYYFNGRPFRLQAYRASPKINLDKNNFSSNLFFNKKIIY